MKTVMDHCTSKIFMIGKHSLVSIGKFRKKQLYLLIENVMHIKQTCG